ncbi:TPA: hypothetical protein EYP66_15315 [Candidatus Poribacteria bacterium]|nr:hypothetical protein [Candidatus Poribacteria bacterium]
MNIKQYISKNLIDFKSISLIYSDAVVVPKYTAETYSEVSIQKSPEDTSAFWANSGSDFISAIVFIFIPSLILLGIVVGLYRWRKRISQYRRHSERLESTTISEKQPVTTPQEYETDIAFQSIEEMALHELKKAQRFRERGQIAEYSEAISWAIKKYVGEKYHIKILGVSTSQILDNLPHELTDSVFDYVGEILRTCDMIGLAQHRPSRGELDHIYQISTTFIQSQIQPDDSEDERSEE